MPPISTPAIAAPAQPGAAPPRRHGGFREFLSELNPLQYIPVIGTIYRAVTGDTIPETARAAGSLVVSGLTGGPIGIALNLGAVAIEKATGIDPERIGQRVLASLGIGGASIGGAGPAAASGHAAPVAIADIARAAQDAAPGAASAPPARIAWSGAQLAAYGVSIDAAGILQRGAVSGSDVLNDLELARHGPVAIA